MRLLLWLALLAACPAKSQTPVTPLLPDDKAAPSDAPPAKPIAKPEAWAGTIVLPGELVDIVVHFTQTGDTWTATLDVPSGKVTNFPLTDVVYSTGEIRFTIGKPDPRTNEIYAFKRDGSAAEGRALIAGQPFYAKLMRLAEGQPPLSVISRPQTPKAPFPYTTKDVEIEAAKDATLAGTLTLPEGKGPFPAVLLVSGSGQQDRDESIFGHKPFALLADKLARDGIATLRTDDRGIGKTTGPLGTLDTDIADAKAAFDWLAKQPEIDGKRAGILGHSIGGVIAPFVATKSKVAFIVGLAAPGVSGIELVPMQMEITLKSSQVPADVMKVIIDGQRTLGKAVATGKEAEIKAAFKKTSLEAMKALGRPTPTDAEIDAGFEARKAEVMNPWTISFFRTDPAVAWVKLRIPVLLVTGDKDTQVPADVNFDRITTALKKAGNKSFKTEKRVGLNHLSQHAPTGAIDEYGAIEETFDKETLELISKWVVETTRKR